MCNDLAEAMKALDGKKLPELLPCVNFISMECVHYWGKAICFFHILALEEFVPRKAQDGEIGWKD